MHDRARVFFTKETAELFAGASQHLRDFIGIKARKALRHMDALL